MTAPRLSDLEPVARAIVAAALAAERAAMIRTSGMVDVPEARAGAATRPGSGATPGPARRRRRAAA